MTLSPCLAGTLTFPRPQQLVTTTATANTAMALAATPSYTDDFEQQRNEMKENGIDASMIQSTLPNLTVDRIQTKTKQKHQRKPSTLRALSVQMAGKLFSREKPLLPRRPRPSDNPHGQANVAGPRRSSFRRTSCMPCRVQCVTMRVSLSVCIFLSVCVCFLPPSSLPPNRPKGVPCMQGCACLFPRPQLHQLSGRSCHNFFDGTVTDD